LTPEEYMTEFTKHFEGMPELEWNKGLLWTRDTVKEDNIKRDHAIERIIQRFKREFGEDSYKGFDDRYSDNSKKPLLKALSLLILSTQLGGSSSYVTTVKEVMVEEREALDSMLKSQSYDDDPIIKFFNGVMSEKKIPKGLSPVFTEELKDVCIQDFCGRLLIMIGSLQGINDWVDSEVNKIGKFIITYSCLHNLKED